MAERDSGDLRLKIYVPNRCRFQTSEKREKHTQCD